MRLAGFGLWLVLALAVCADARAGAGCDARAVTPQALAEAAATALQVQAALDRRGAPLALLARRGTDLSEHALLYSHAGFVVRDHRDGRWSVVHLLNRCGSDRSALHVEGLVNFFADDLHSQDARLVWLEPALESSVLLRLDTNRVFDLHQSRYNLIARPGSSAFQNSTAWVLETLAAARLAPTGAPLSRRTVAMQLDREGWPADIIAIPYRQRLLGGLFGGANLSFTDHPVRSRIAGRYPVITVRSVLRWLEARGSIAGQREWRNRVEQARPGPA